MQKLNTVKNFIVHVAWYNWLNSCVKHRETLWQLSDIIYMGHRITVKDKSINQTSFIYSVYLMIWNTDKYI